MSQEIAQYVVIGITLVGAVVWVASLTFLVKSTRRVWPVEPHEFAEPAARGVLTGCAEVEGDTKTLSNLAAAYLAKGAWGPVKIVEKSDDRIVFVKLDPYADHAAGRWFRQGELRFTSLRQNRTEVAWTVEPGNFSWMLWVGGIFQCLGLLALSLGCWALMTFIAPAAEPGVRWQSIQMVQAVHVLWPPFLLAGRYRKGMNGIAAEFTALANNLPYLGKQT